MTTKRFPPGLLGRPPFHRGAAELLRLMTAGWPLDLLRFEQPILPDDGR